MRKRLAFAGILIAVLLVTFAAPVLAQGDRDGKVIFGGNFTLAGGETLSSDLGMFGGNVTLMDGSTVNGDVLVAGGNLQAAGLITGDIAVFGGNVRLASTAVVHGSVLSFGGTVDRAEGAQVFGDVTDGVALPWPGTFDIPVVPSPPLLPRASESVQLQTSPADWLIVQFLRLIRTIGVTLALTALALIVALFWPKGIERIGTTATEQPFVAFAVGIAGWLGAIIVILLLLITICLSPFALVLLLVLVAAILLSVVAAGWVVGRKLAAVVKVRNASTVLEAVVGTLILVFTFFLVGIVPLCCAQFVYGSVVVSLGLGAIILTRFGTRPYRRGGPSVRPAPSSPPPPALPPADAPESRQIRSAAELGLPPAASASSDEPAADDDIIHLPPAVDEEPSQPDD